MKTAVSEYLDKLPHNSFDDDTNCIIKSYLCSWSLYICTFYMKTLKRYQTMNDQATDFYKEKNSYNQYTSRYIRLWQQLHNICSLLCLLASLQSTKAPEKGTSFRGAFVFRHEIKWTLIGWSEINNVPSQLNFTLGQLDIPVTGVSLILCQIWLMVRLYLIN